MSQIDDGGQLAAVSFRDGCVLSALQGMLARENLVGAGKATEVAKKAYEYADAVIARKREDEKPKAQETTEPKDG
jgi:hypothetical protein